MDWEDYWWLAVLLAGCGALVFVILFCIQKKRNMFYDDINTAIYRGPNADFTFYVEELDRTLPAAARRYFLHSVKPNFQLSHTATVFVDGNIPEFAFRARLHITPQVGYNWNYQLLRNGVWLDGCEYLADGVASQQFSLLGFVNVMEGTADIEAFTQSALGRLAVESVFIPSSFLPMYGVRWEEIDENTATAYVQVHGREVPVTITVDAKGRLKEVVAMRLSTELGREVPFGFRVNQEREFISYVVPAELKGGWFYGTPDCRFDHKYTVKNISFA